MKKSLIFIHFIVVLSSAMMVACSKPSDNPQPGGTAGPTTTVSPPVSPGGADIGGCNGVQSRCFEDFIQRIDAKPEFKEFMLPIFKKLKAISPSFAADILHLIRERNWYFVPVELNQIPSEYLGVGFKTEQIALHTKKEIWISTLYYDSKTSNARTKGLTLLHELIMGVRFMEFQSSLDKCYAYAARHLVLEKDEEEAMKLYRRKKSDCRTTYPNPLDSGRALEVTRQMNEDIRALTNIILNKLDEMDADEFEDWIRRTEFRAY